jgi:LAO/AO transport system kinase
VAVATELVGGYAGRVRATDPVELLAAARSGDRSALARLLTLVDQQGVAANQIDRLVATPSVGPAPSNRSVIGVTGAPGAGKSTLVDCLITEYRSVGLSVAVLAIDPSSPFSGGAILGDRVRMGDHSIDEGVFIRSFASRGSLGGLTVSIPSALRVLKAAGFDRLIVETVGVGQVELDVVGVADSVVVVVNPGWGDEVQAAKAGLMEIADLFVVNKADRPGAAETEADLLGMQHLSLGAPSGWRPGVILTSALNHQGITQLAEALDAHQVFLIESSAGGERRRLHIEREITQRVAAELAKRAGAFSDHERWQSVLTAVVNGDLAPTEAVDELLGP